MKATIIVFSPQGNTLKVGKMLKMSLTERKVRTQLIDITRDGKLFKEGNNGHYLKELVEGHDVLLVGSPVYAHHLHYNVKDLIRSLPQPGNGWGRFAVPFVTYGNINSGVALKEAGELLKRSGRIVVSGMKINSMHCLTKLKEITTKINEGMPGDEALPDIENLVGRIIQLENVKLKDYDGILKDLDYQSRKVKVKANLIFREKFWHRHLYPDLVFNQDACNACGKCAKVCSVQRIEMTEDGPIFPEGNPGCIHCASCVVNCPMDAISFDADWVKWNRLIEKAANGFGPLPSNEKPRSAVYPRDK